MKKLICFFIALAFVGCQSTPSRRYAERSIANTGILKVFVREVAESSEKYAARELEEQIEKRLKDYLREVPADGEFGNWARMGITKEQAMKIEGLYDDLPYMNKVQKWVMENVTVLMHDVRPSMARAAYKKILGPSGRLFDPYHGLTDDVQGMAMARRNQTMPEHLRRNRPAARPKSVVDEIQARNYRLVAATESLEGVDDTAKNYLLKNLKMGEKIAKDNPLLASNIHHSVEGSLLITKKTGQRAIGKGCQEFNEKASAEVLELKARVDMRRAELVEKRAYDKNGGAFNKVDDVPAEKRLTKEELDEITEEAFEDVLGYSRVEARAAMKRLKSPPCQVY